MFGKKKHSPMNGYPTMPVKQRSKQNNPIYNYFMGSNLTEEEKELKVNKTIAGLNRESRLLAAKERVARQKERLSKHSGSSKLDLGILTEPKGKPPKGFMDLGF